MAAAFFYFQWNYTKFKTIDFEESVFYGKDYIFLPQKDEYLVLLYNSKISDAFVLAREIPNDAKIPIIAIDFYQNTAQIPKDSVIPISAGMNTLLKFANSFKITSLPVYFEIKRKSVNKFSQNSKITLIF